MVSISISRPDPLDVMLIGGAGLHSRRAHIPFLREHPELARLALIVEVPAKAAEAQAIADSFPGEVEVLIVEPWSGPFAPAIAMWRMREAVRVAPVDVVVIAADPVAHSGYLRWALGFGKPIYVDKPIVVFPGVSNEPALARRLASDVEDLALSSGRRKVPVHVGTQRFHHPGFQLAKEALVNASRLFGTPITRMRSSHSDGQFRLPHELETVSYHGYDQGYGKLGHSGYHETSIQALMAASCAEAAGVAYDALTSYAAAMRPASFLRQTPRATYERQWGREAWAQASPDSHQEIAARTARFGELDVDATSTFWADGVPMLTSQISLGHNTFSRRSWLEPRADWYKGQGRSKHESHVFDVGPFLSVQIHSYQSSDEHDLNDESDFAPGGNNHFDIHLFRNADWWKDPRVPAHETITSADLAERAGVSADTLFTSDAKGRMLAEFYECAAGIRPWSGNRSLIGDHILGSSLHSAITESVASGQPTTRSLAPRLSEMGGAA